MKPSLELLRNWSIEAHKYANDTKTSEPYPDSEWEDIFNTKFAELAAQWGVEQAQHDAKNAPWLTTAHMICTDAGIAHGHITERLKALRDMLAEQAQQTTPEGFVRVPLVMTQAMEEVTQQEDWQWADLLAAAEAVTEEQYNMVQAQQPPVEEPELPEPYGIVYSWDKGSRRSFNYGTYNGAYPSKSSAVYTAVQMRAYYQSGVRVGRGQQSQWRTIDSAPKDGRSFDVWVKSTKNPDYGVRMTGVYYVQGVLCGSKFPNSSWCEYASHWMPLPAPPAMQGDNHE